MNNVDTICIMLGVLVGIAINVVFECHIVSATLKRIEALLQKRGENK